MLFDLQLPIPKPLFLLLHVSQLITNHKELLMDYNDLINGIYDVVFQHFFHFYLVNVLIKPY